MFKQVGLIKQHSTSFGGFELKWMMGGPIFLLYNFLENINILMCIGVSKFRAGCPFFK